MFPTWLPRAMGLARSLAGWAFRAPWLYATDHCPALDRILSQGKLGSTYCIGGARGFCGEAARLSVLQEAGLPELLQP